MNLFSKLFNAVTPVKSSPSPRRVDNHYLTAQIAPEVWTNFGVEVEEVGFDVYESMPSAARQREMYNYM